jgi:hypothetical protein
MFKKLLIALLLLPAVASAQTVLENGTAVVVPSTAQDQFRSYTLVVPSNMSELRVILTGGSGDADLYVNYNEPFLGGTDLTAECASENPGDAEETCALANPTPGTWYIEVNGATAFGGSPELVAVAMVELTDNVARTPLSAADGDEDFYFIEVPAGQGHLTVTTSGGTGNPNMNVGADLFSAPDCSSGSSNTTDSCAINQPAAGTWFVKITATDAYSGASLTAEYGPENAPGLDSDGGALPPASLGLLLLAGLLSASGSRRPRAPGAR